MGQHWISYRSILFIVSLLAQYSGHAQTDLYVASFKPEAEEFHYPGPLTLSVVAGNAGAWADSCHVSVWCEAGTVKYLVDQQLFTNIDSAAYVSFETSFTLPDTLFAVDTLTAIGFAVSIEATGQINDSKSENNTQKLSLPFRISFVELKEFRTFPNPLPHEELSLHLILAGKAHDAQLRAYSIDGQEVESPKPVELFAGKNLLTWTTATWQSGVYLIELRLTGADGIQRFYTAKVVKTKTVAAP